MLSKFKRDEKARERKRLHCIDCKRVTIHNLEARCVGAWNDPYHNESGGERYSIFRCGACDAVCYETTSWDNQVVEYDEDNEPYHPESSIQYPAPVSAHFNFNTESTPAQLNAILDEMLYTLAGSKMTLATIGLRLAIEFIVKDKDCAGRTLVNKINDLHNQGLIDEDQRDLLHRIRQRGNASAHKAIGMNAMELVAAMSIIEGLLENLYNSPERHARTIRNAKRLLREDDQG